MQNRPTTEDRLGQSSSGYVRYFLLAMTLVYIGLGIYLWLTPPEALNLAPLTRRILGGTFVFYGILRFVRTYRQHFQRPSSHDDSSIR
jgi:hypothetical protein